MDARNQKLEQQRQLMEQKMKQKRQTSGMIQASDIRANSAKSRTNSGMRVMREHKQDWEVLINLMELMGDECEDEVLTCGVAQQRTGSAKMQLPTLRFEVKKIRKLRTIFDRKKRLSEKPDIQKKIVSNFNCCTPKKKRCGIKVKRALLSDFSKNMIGDFSMKESLGKGNEVNLIEPSNIDENNLLGLKENQQNDEPDKLIEVLNFDKNKLPNDNFLKGVQENNENQLFKGGSDKFCKGTQEGKNEKQNFIIEDVKLSNEGKQEEDNNKNSISKEYYNGNKLSITELSKENYNMNKLSVDQSPKIDYNKDKLSKEDYNQNKQLQEINYNNKLSIDELSKDNFNKKETRANNKISVDKIHQLSEDEGNNTIENDGADKLPKDLLEDSNENKMSITESVVVSNQETQKNSMEDINKRSKKIQEGNNENQLSIIKAVELPIVETETGINNNDETHKLSRENMRSENGFVNDWEFVDVNEENYIIRAMMKCPDLFNKIKEHYFKTFNVEEKNLCKPELMVCHNLLMEYLIAQEKPDKEKMNVTKEVLMEYVNCRFCGSIDELQDYMQYNIAMYNLSRQICLKYGV